MTALLGIFYISTFIDLADKMFRGEATTALLLRFFYFQTPQFVYYVIPIAVLVATLVTVGVMTKNSELLVMRACGISLYRTSAPLVLFGLAASGAALSACRSGCWRRPTAKRDRLNRMIRSQPPQTYGVLNRRWIVGTGGEIYHYDVRSTRPANQFTRLSVYQMDEQSWRLARDGRTRAKLSASRAQTADGRPAGPRTAGWTREFATAGATRRGEKSVRYAAFARAGPVLEPPDYFKNRGSRRRADDVRRAEGRTSTQLERQRRRRRAATWWRCSGRSRFRS